MHSPQPQLLHPHTSISVTLVPSHSLRIHTSTQTTIHASQSQQPPHPHRVSRQPHRQTNDDPMTTQTTQTQRPSERNVITLQVNINGIKNKLEELKLFPDDTHAYIITIQKTKLTPKAKTAKVHNFTTVRTDRLLKAVVGSLQSLETTLHSLQQTYIRPFIHTTQNFKWSRYTLTTQYICLFCVLRVCELFCETIRNVVGVVAILLLYVMEVFSVDGGDLLDRPCKVFQIMCIVMCMHD